MSPAADQPAAAVDRLIVAADVPLTELPSLLADLDGVARWIKVGSTLFAEGGPDLVRSLHGQGWRVFLDLKLHDIPHQVELTTRALAGLGADLLTIHAAGGAEMIAAARQGLSGHATRLLAVTVLTSLDGAALRAIGCAEPPEQLVLRRARLAIDHGAHGLVASAQEARTLRAELGRDLHLVTPGVRPSGSDPGDQARVMTPADAIAAGATQLVVGRPITGAADRRDAARRLVSEIARAS